MTNAERHKLNAQRKNYISGLITSNLEAMEDGEYSVQEDIDSAKYWLSVIKEPSFQWSIDHLMGRDDMLSNIETYQAMDDEAKNLLGDAINRGDSVDASYYQGLKDGMRRALALWGLPFGAYLESSSTSAGRMFRPRGLKDLWTRR